MSKQPVFRVGHHHFSLADHLILTIQPQTNIEDTSSTNMEGKPFSSTTVQPGVENSPWAIAVGRHHLKYTTVKLLASNSHLWNNHGCGFVGWQQHATVSVKVRYMEYFYHRLYPWKNNTERPLRCRRSMPPMNVSLLRQESLEPMPSMKCYGVLGMHRSIVARKGENYEAKYRTDTNDPYWEPAPAGRSGTDAV